MSVVQYAVLNDIHFPYEGACYYKALDQMKSWPNLKKIYLNGDIAEIESVSSHPKSPEAQQVLLHELDYVNKKFDQIQKMFPGVPVQFIEGNHCYRILRYIRDVAPQMWGLIHTPKLFKFDERGWNFVPYGPTQWAKCGSAKDLWLRHEPLAGGASHAKATADRAYVSVIYGHTHQYQIHTVKKIGPKPYHVTAMSAGWLGDIRQPCFDYRGAKDNWVNGFTRIDCDEKTGEYEIRFIYL
jgi:UDP-2,3-diacylglucosamine pyrophosphatase LpxH